MNGTWHALSVAATQTANKLCASGHSWQVGRRLEWVCDGRAGKGGGGRTRSVSVRWREEVWSSRDGLIAMYDLMSCLKILLFRVTHPSSQLVPSIIAAITDHSATSTLSGL